MTKPWVEWEDYSSGLYAAAPIDKAKVEASRALLADPDQFLEVAVEMIREWPNGARHGIHHLPAGAQAWVGQASCCYAHGATAAETRDAWGQLTNPQQRAANKAADVAIERFQREVIDDAQTLFGR